jgi:acyl carrier protein
MKPKKKKPVKLGNKVSRNVVSHKPVVDSSDPSTWPDDIIYGARKGMTGKKGTSAEAGKVVNKGQIIADKKAKHAASGKEKMGLCPDKKLFTKVLKEEISLNVAKEGVKVTLKSKLKEDLDLDSLEAIEMLLDLEDKYGVEIDNTLMDFNKIQTVGHLRDFLFDKTLFPEDITKRDEERAKQAKVKAKEQKKMGLETTKIFTDEYSQGEYSDAGMTVIDAEKEMKKLDEEEGEPKIKLPKGGKQVE